MNGESRLEARLRSTLEQQAVGVDEIDTPSALLGALDRSARRTRRTRFGYAAGGVLAAAAAAIVVVVIGPSGLRAGRNRWHPHRRPGRGSGR